MNSEQIHHIIRETNHAHFTVKVSVSHDSDIQDLIVVIAEENDLYFNTHPFFYFHFNGNRAIREGRIELYPDISHCFIETPWEADILQGEFDYLLGRGVINLNE